MDHKKRHSRYWDPQRTAKRWGLNRRMADRPRSVGTAGDVFRHALQQTAHWLHQAIDWVGHLPPARAAALALLVLVVISVPVVLAVNAAPGDDVIVLGATPSPSPTPADVAAFQGGMAMRAALDGEETADDAPPAAQDTPPPTPEPTPVPTPTPPPHPSNTIIEQGIEAPVVAEIQERLMELGYMDNDEPTQYFGGMTQTAILLFQRQHGLSTDGRVGLETYTLLMSDQAQRYTVMEGAEGEDVSSLQTRLRELGYMDKVTGFFGEETTKGVKLFQKYNDLYEDGKVGSKTRELIYSADAKAYFLKYGEKSEEVKDYQQRLKNLGYLTTTPDGNYGSDTVAAVKRFQDINGIIADGFLGPQTIELLKSGKARANALVLGVSGSDVENVQKRLQKLGYMGHVTGYFGSETESAVKSFQKRNGLGVDGTVGKQTMAALTSSGAKKAASGGSGSSGGSSGSSGGSSSSSSAASSAVEKFIEAAQAKKGSKYVWGAKGPNTFDCSGFVYYCLKQAGVSQSYMTSSAWAKTGKYQKVGKIANLQRGDVLVFKGHVGIYLGNGGMIDASSSKGKVVTRSDVWSSSYWNRNFVSGFRIF